MKFNFQDVYLIHVDELVEHFSFNTRSKASGQLLSDFF